MRLKLAAAIVATSALLTTLALASPANAETRRFDLSGFTRIDAEAGYTIEFTQSPTWSVEVDSKHDNFGIIIVEKVGDTLRIRRAKDTSHKGKVDDIVRVSAPDIERLKLSAAIEFSAPRLQVDKLDIDVDAAVSIDIPDLRVETLDVRMDAASEMTVAGTCTRMNLDLGAASHVDSSKLKCREARIDAGVASDVHAYASERAVANAGMSSSIRISGKPADFKKSTERFGSTVTLAN